ncbi:hypothetical protein [Limisphaera sp. VF-2]|jgi:hypothetical protein|uniref:hypothetical protein n=1 Tax=Limisphaera sp. VF-2 TaxID=3400418 RepID=UPI001756A843
MVRRVTAAATKVEISHFTRLEGSDPAGRGGLLEEGPPPSGGGYAFSKSPQNTQKRQNGF